MTKRSPTAEPMRPPLDEDNQIALEKLRAETGIPVGTGMNLILRAAFAAGVEITTKEPLRIETEDGRVLRSRQRLAFRL